MNLNEELEDAANRLEAALCIRCESARLDGYVAVQCERSC